MENIISNNLFYSFHRDSFGGALYSSSVNLTIVSCAFKYCTSLSYGGCFYSEKGIIKVSKSCFYHSQINKQEDFLYGNAFYIENSNQISLEEISSFLCGFDENSCGDSPIATNYSPLKVALMNCTNSATFNGAASITLNNCEHNNLTYLISMYPNGINCYHFIGIAATSSCNYFLCIDSSNLVSIFHVDNEHKFTIQNGIFINPDPNKIINSNAYSRLILINCISTVELPSFENNINYTIIPDFTISNESKIIAEICNQMNYKKCNTIICNKHVITTIQLFVIFIY